MSRKGVLVTAFREYTSGDGMELRLWEQAGKSGLCHMGLPDGRNFSQAYRCNLRGEIMDNEGIEISNNSFLYMIQANQPVSFILK